MPERNNEYVYQPPAKFTEELRQRINNAGFSDEFKQQIKLAQKEEGRKMFERRRHNMNEIERTIRDLQLYVDVKWGGTNDMLNLALTALKDFCKLQKENEQLRAQVARYKEILEQASDALKYAEGYTQYSAEARVREAVAAIDKALGGKEE